MKTRLSWCPAKCSSHFFYYPLHSFLSLLLFWNCHFTELGTSGFILYVSIFKKISLLCLFQFWKISSSLSARLLTWSSAISVLCLSPLIEIFKCNHISHFQEWFLLLWLLHFTMCVCGYNSLSDPPDGINSGESTFSSLPQIISAYSRVKHSVSPFGSSLLWCVFSSNVLRSLGCCFSFTNKGSSWLLSKRPGFSLQLHGSPQVASPWNAGQAADCSHLGRAHLSARLPVGYKGREPTGRPGRPPHCQSKDS